MNTINLMGCLFGRHDEKAELRELLESSNAQREEYRKAADSHSHALEHLSKQLEQKLMDLQELSHQFQSLQQSEARLSRENEVLQQQITGYKQSLNKAAANQEEVNKSLQKETTQRKQADSDLRKLHKEREYLRMRVDRMQHALSILESVMDDTLRVSQTVSSNSSGGSKSGNSYAADMLRQSINTASMQQLQDMIRSSKLEDAKHAPVDDQTNMATRV